MDLGQDTDATKSQGSEQYPYPTTMPGSARAAQIISWLFAGLGIVLVVIAVANGYYELGGALTAGFLPAFFLALFAFGYTINGNGLRIASTVFACLGIFVGFGSGAQGIPFGPLGGLLSLIIVILLTRPATAAWFKRPH